MNKKPLFFLALVIILSSCNKVGTDRSYPVKEYIKQGIPEINRPWNNDEFASAVNILRLIKANDSLALPRYDSRKSGPLFRHMISMDNLFFLSGDLISLHDKTFMLQNFLNIEGMLTAVYKNRQQGIQYYSKELIQLYIFAIAITQKMLDLAYEINISENRDARCMKSGLPSVQHLYEQMLLYVLKEQTHVSSYEKKDQEILSENIDAAVRKNRDWFDTPTQDLLKRYLQKVNDHTSSEKIKKIYSELLTTLEKQ